MDLSSNQTKLHRALPAGQDPPATPAQLAEATGLGYSTVTRLLRELADAGHAVKDGGGWRATGPTGHPDPRHEPDHGATNPDADATNPDADATDRDADATDTSDTDEPAEAAKPPSGPAAAPPVAGPATGEGPDNPGPGVDPGGEPVAGDTAARGDDPPPASRALRPDDPDDDGVEPVPPVADGDPAPGRGRLRKGELPKQVLAALREHPGEALSPHRLTKQIGARSSGAVGNACDALVKAGLAELATDRPRTFRATTAD